MGNWTIRATPQVRDWVRSLPRTDPATAAAVKAAVDELAAVGPGLGRPLVDTVRRSRHSNMKELRPRSGRNIAIRILFAFDPKRQGVLLIVGDKAGNWSDWYRTAIPQADDAFDTWLKQLDDTNTDQPQ